MASLRRRFAREATLQMLYQIDVGGAAVEDAINWMRESVALDPAMEKFAIELVKGVVENLAAIDDLLSRYSIGWEVSRMAAVDRNLLRLGVYEMFYRDDIPLAVTINEIVEISKRYGDVRSASFLNGILGSIKRDIEEFGGPALPVKKTSSEDSTAEEE